MELSIVLPAYNAAPLLGRSLERLLAFLEGEGAGRFEVIVVDDGSTDETASLARGFGGPVRLLAHPVNRGKGAAVATGMLDASGALRLFMDCDLPYRLSVVPPMLAALKGGADVVTGTRALAESTYVVGSTFGRRLASHVFTFIVSEIMRMGVLDTQCGIKGFRAAAARYLYGQLSVERFAADVELLAIALRQGMRIQSFPVELMSNDVSTVSLGRDAPQMVLDLVRVARRVRRGELPPWRPEEEPL